MSDWYKERLQESLRELAGSLSAEPEPKRDWRFKTSQSIQTCTFCGGSIVPGEMFFRDVDSGHLNAHRVCLKSDNEKKAGGRDG